MTPAQFVNSLKEATPSIAELRSIGLNQAEARDFLRRYRCSPKKRGIRRSLTNDPLVDLLSNWNTGNLAIGMVQFLKSPMVTTTGTQIADLEVDAVLVAADGEVHVIEENTGRFLWRAAVDGAHFLDALVFAAKFFRKRLLGLVSEDDMKAAHAAAHHCSRAAGGRRFKHFYLMLFGVG